MPFYVFVSTFSTIDTRFWVKSLAEATFGTLALTKAKFCGRSLAIFGNRSKLMVNIADVAIVVSFVKL